MNPNTLMAMTPEEVHNYLEHHGIKGMRWGVRRTPEELGHRLKARNARHYGKYNKAVAKIGKIQGDKTVNQLSTKEKEKMVKAVEKAQSYLKKMASDEKKYGKKIIKAEAREAEEKEKTAAKEAAKSAEDQKLKEKLLKKQKWEDIYKNKDLFTTQELSDVATRINAEKRVQDALESNSVDKLTKKVKSVAGLVGAGVELHHKIKDVQGIFESGQREKAYKEIRQLMAEGNNAEVIKKSVGIADGDVEKFNKRLGFLRALNANVDSNIKSSTTAKESSTRQKILDSLKSDNRSTAEKAYDKVKDIWEDTVDSFENKRKVGTWDDIIYGDILDSSGNVIGSAGSVIHSEFFKNFLQHGTIDLSDSIIMKIIKSKDPSVIFKLLEIGDYKYSDLKK